MKENNIAHTDEIFASLSKFKTIANAVNKYTEASTIDNGRKEIKEKGTELINKAKSLW